ncbi:MAG: phosphorylase [Promethearchaeota archaeon]|nr:MAG: phosphorylase [Candidatus Lokiarchaeota archaeon]
MNLSENNYPILEFYPEKEALIEPSKILKQMNVPDICIIPLYRRVFQVLEEKGYLEIITELEGNVLPNLKFYRLDLEGFSITLVSPCLGSPFAAINLDYAITLGCSKFLVIGSCGVLDSEIERNQLIIPTSAIRDEGTSYHYIPPSREIEMDPEIVSKIHEYLNNKGIKNRMGKTWTTGGIFRETPSKIRARKAEGAITVEMEAAALFAVTKFRKVKLGYILAAGDDVSGLEWDRRLTTKSLDFYEKFFWLSVDVASAIYG